MSDRRRSVISSLALVGLLLSGSLGAQTNPDLGKCNTFYSAGYTLAEGRLNPNPISMLKPLKGQVFAEPNFGTCEVRATDHANEAPVNFARNDYSRRQAFNADNTRFFVYSNDGFWHLYDANSLQHLKRLPFLAGDAEPQWDALNPNKLFYLPTNGGTQLLALDTTTDQSQVVVNFSGRLPSWAANARHIWTKSEGSPSADGRYWGFQVEDSGFNLLGYVTWDIVEDRMIGSMQSSSRPDHTSMTPSGRWFTISGNGTWAWSLDFSQKKKLHNGGEHSDIALMGNGHDAYVAVDYQTNAGDIFFTDIDSCPSVPAATSTAPVCPRVVLFPNYINGAATALHVSGKGYKKPGWVIVSTYGDSLSRDGSRPWYTNKVLVVELKDNPRIYPLAYTHRVEPTGSFAYWSEPHASVNRDFTRVIYNSNWEVDSETNLDAYIVHIPKNFFGDVVPQEPVCTRTAPSIALSGNTAAVAPCTAIVYTATVRNQDTTACAATTFNLTGTAPSGWGSSLPVSSLSLSPGASATATWSVASPSTATTGNYALTFGVSSSQSAHAASTAINYQVNAPTTCTRAAPVLMLSGNATNQQAGSAFVYTATLRNQDSSGCSATAFSLSGTVPSGWGSSLPVSSLNVAPGASATASWSVASPSNVATGTYPVSLRVSSSQAVHAVSASNSYGAIATPVCQRNAPLVSLTGPTSGVLAGANAVYQVRVANQDTAQCASTFFSLASSAPSGWTKSLSASSLNIAPGASATSNLTVRSLTSTSPGAYTIGVGTAIANASLHTRSASATITIQAPPAVCVRNKPNVVVGAATSSNGQSTYPITVKNMDTAACASTYFGLNAKQPAGSSGWGLNLIRGGNTVAPGATWTTSLVVSPPANLAAGNYQLPIDHSSQQGAHGGTVYAPYTKRTTGGVNPPRTNIAKTQSLIAPKQVTNTQKVSRSFLVNGARKGDSLDITGVAN
jgi:hypothetical protein